MQIFGIRHHGPGSALSLLGALEKMQPDCILIEGPADAQHVIEYAKEEDMKPPVAILVYNPKDFTQVAYFPFAVFSPEWQAIQFALKHNIKVAFIDLPYSQQQIFAKDENLNLFTTPQDKNSLEISLDPLGYLATLAGYKDRERFWEVTFEQKANPEDIFDAITQMMSELRQAAENVQSTETLAREAFMRKSIREYEKLGFQNIAVVCGAWHAPALYNIHKYKPTQDNTLLKGLKKTNSQATWIPWSNERLSTLNGYGAGVLSPFWYQLLFEQKNDVEIHWMTEVARLIRAEDLDASSAHIIDAVRLAVTLATLRGLEIAGIDELKEAAITTICNGNADLLKLIEKKLIIGEGFGTVPATIPLIPLHQDIESSIKSARLTKEWNSIGVLTKSLDLRVNSNLLASQLLHRLNLLNIAWAKEVEGSDKALGAFAEHWQLERVPEAAFAIIEAGAWGNTVENATTNFINKKAALITQLPELTALIENVLKAELPTLINILVLKLQSLSTQTQDVLLLMDTLPSLVNIVKYGSTRQTDINAVLSIVEELIPRICIMLPNATQNTDDDLATQTLNKLLKANYAIHALNEKENIQLWNKTLYQIAQSMNVHGLLVGVSQRLLFDKGELGIPYINIAMQFIFSKGEDTFRAMHWLEGFLQGSGLILLHHPNLWNILKEWVLQLDTERFKELLPLLRRTFATFSAHEREKILQLLQTKSQNDYLENKMSNQRATIILEGLRIFV